MQQEKKEVRRLSVSLSDDTAARLQEIAHSMDRSLSWLIAHAVKSFIKEHDNAETDGNKNNDGHAI